MIELTDQQQRAVDSDPIPQLIDPRTKKAYVLLAADVFERIQSFLEEDDGLNMRQVGILIEEAMREDDANDPLLESYQNYRRKA
jgi:hypothetical protein